MFILIIQMIYLIFLKFQDKKATLYEIGFFQNKKNSARKAEFKKFF